MDWNEIFDKLNNEGVGFPVGEPDDDVNQIAGLGDIIKTAETDDDVAVYYDGNKYTIVGDANGPWAVEWPD